MWLIQRQQEVVRQQHALAADLVVRCHALPQGGILDLPLGMAPGPPFHGPHQPGRNHEAHRLDLVRRVDPAAFDPAQPGRRAQQRLAGRPGDRIVLGQDPGRGALEQRQGRGLVRQSGHDLDRARAGADHRHALALEPHRMVPAGGVERRSREPLQTRDRRKGRVVQRARRQYQHAGGQGVSSLGTKVPQAGGRIVCRLGQRGPQIQMRADSETIHAVQQVALDFRLGRVAPRPVARGGKGKGIERGGYVAGAAGIGVVAPGPADLRCLLQHHEVIQPRLQQPDRHPDAGEPRAHDDHAMGVRIVDGVSGVHGRILTDGWGLWPPCFVIPAPGMTVGMPRQPPPTRLTRPTTPPSLPTEEQ